MDERKTDEYLHISKYICAHTDKDRKRERGEEIEREGEEKK